MFSHLKMKSMLILRRMILFFFNPSSEFKKLIFCVFNSKVLSILMIIVEISSVFIFKISTNFFVRFFDCVGFIVYVFDMTMTFFFVRRIDFDENNKRCFLKI